MKVKFENIICRVEGKVNAQTTDIPNYLGKGHGECGEIAITQHGDLLKDRATLGMAFRFSFKKGDVLFMSRSFSNRKAGMAMFDGICSEKTFVLRTKDGNILLQKYLPLIIQNDEFWEYCEENKAGGVNNFINWKTIANYELDIPSIEEQKIIANKTWAAYRLKEGYKKLLAATDEMVKSQFIEMFGTSCDSVKTILSDFVSLKAGKNKKSELIKDVFTDGLYPCYGGNGIRGYVEDYTHSGIYCIIGRQGAQCGNVQIAEGEFYATEHAVVVTPLTDVNSIWLFHALTQMNLNQYARGAAQPGLAVNQLEILPFSLPSIASQTQFALIAEQADKSKFADFKSQFIEMFGTLDEPKVNVSKLIDVVVSSGQYGSNTSATDYQEGKPRYIRITDINDDGSLNDDIKTAEVIDDKYRLESGDIVFARTGATVGKTYLHEAGDAIYAGYLIKYQMDSELMKPLFMKAFTHSKTYYNWVANSQKVGAQPNISATQYDQMPILVPSVDEQEAFLKIYQQADKSKFELKQCIGNIDKVIKSLINNHGNDETSKVQDQEEDSLLLNYLDV